MKSFKVVFSFLILMFCCKVVFPEHQKNISLNNKKITIYYYPECAGCKFVVNSVKKNKVWQNNVVLIDATPKEKKEKLRKLRGDGRAAGPYLLDQVNDTRVPGGQKIVKYLKEPFG